MTDDPRERLTRVVEAEAPARPEAWTRAALITFALFALLIFYLGLRPGGVSSLRPSLVYTGRIEGTGPSV